MEPLVDSFLGETFKIYSTQQGWITTVSDEPSQAIWASGTQSTCQEAIVKVRKEILRQFCRKSKFPAVIYNLEGRLLACNCKCLELFGDVRGTVAYDYHVQASDGISLLQQLQDRGEARVRCSLFSLRQDELATGTVLARKIAVDWIFAEFLG
jgi:hypothetical protein